MRDNQNGPAAAIQISKLTKRYARQKGAPAVKDLTITVPAGEIYGFLGANGAGKTTTIKILLGLQFASEGEVKVLGEDPTSKEAKRRIGYLPERPYFHDSMRLDEFLDFHRALFGKPRAGEMFKSNDELAELVGLSDARGKNLRQFSKGMLQRAGIAQALVNDPRLIILDEPMSGLDPVGRREVRDLILRLGAEGRTIFLSSHILSDVEQICHRIAFLEKGELRREGRVEDLLRTAKGSFELTFTGQDLGKLFPNAKASPAQGVLVACQTAEEARALIEKGWSQGATLVSCVPHHRALEDVLFGSEKV